MCTFTTDFDRQRAGFSPDRVDALVWALSDLMVQPMRSWGAYELARRQAAEIEAAKSARSVKYAEPVYQPGSMEWQRQQEERLKSGSQ
jgi:hypothetical protein